MVSTMVLGYIAAMVGLVLLARAAAGRSLSPTGGREPVRRPVPSVDRRRLRAVALRVLAAASAFGVVVIGVSFFRPDLALWAGAVVLPFGVWWVVRAADPARIDMDDLDRALMQLLEEERHDGG